MSLRQLGFGDVLTAVCEKYILLFWNYGGEEREPCVMTEVALVICMGGDVEIPLNHVMVCVVSGVLDVDIMEHAAVCHENLVHLGPHHPPLTENALCLAVSRP